MTVIDTDPNASLAATKPKRAGKPRAQAVAIHQPQALATSPNPVSIVERAIEKGITGADLKEVMDLQERWEASQARKAFDIAMANAQGDMPLLIKNRLVDFPSEKAPGGRVTYRHEDLAEVVSTITPILKKHGLAHRFRTEQLDQGQIRVTCIITGHGHREENSLQSSRDNGPGRNDLQAIASTLTYLERYTLKAALGLAAAHDDDGKASEGQPSTITAIQLQQLEALAEEVNANIEGACKYLKIGSLAELPASKFERAVQLLEAKRAPL